MSSKNRHLTYALGALLLGATLIVVGPVGAENSTTIDQSTQPNLKAWSNIIPNANRRFVVFADFNNGAVLDRETGLVWEKVPGGTASDWVGATNNCARIRVGGRKGWRLPSIHELASLIDPPSLQVQHFRLAILLPTSRRPPYIGRRRPTQASPRLRGSWTSPMATSTTPIRTMGASLGVCVVR